SIVRVAGAVLALAPQKQVHRYKIHDSDIVFDRVQVLTTDRKRLHPSVMEAMKAAKGNIKIVNKEGDKEQFFSRYLIDAESGISYDEPQPNTCSFNSPYGACPECDGVGYIFEIDKDIVIPNRKISIQK